MSVFELLVDAALKVAESQIPSSYKDYAVVDPNQHLGLFCKDDNCWNMFKHSGKVYNKDYEAKPYGEKPNRCYYEIICTGYQPHTIQTSDDKELFVIPPHHLLTRIICWEDHRFGAWLATLREKRCLFKVYCHHVNCAAGCTIRHEPWPNDLLDKTNVMTTPLKPGRRAKKV